MKKCIWSTTTPRQTLAFKPWLIGFKGPKWVKKTFPSQSHHNHHHQPKHKAGWVHGFMLLMPNFDHSVCVHKPAQCTSELEEASRVKVLIGCFIANKQQNYLQKIWGEESNSSEKKFTDKWEKYSGYCWMQKKCQNPKPREMWRPGERESERDNETRLEYYTGVTTMP